MKRFHSFIIQKKIPIFLYMNFILTFILCCTTFMLQAQGEEKFVIEDFNGDGYIDTLEYHYDGGSGYSGRWCTLNNGKNDDVFKMDSWGCFCNIRKYILIPPELQKEENSSFLKAIEKVLLPEKRNAPDPSLQWILDAGKNKKTLEDSLSEHFDLLFQVPLQWHEGEIESANPYCIEVKGVELDEQYFTHSEKPNWYDKDLNEGWLVYYRSNHLRRLSNEKNKSIEIKGSKGSDIDSISSTAIGITIHKENQYAWLFASDYEITGGPEKLRWPSLLKMEVLENYLLVQHSLAPIGVDHLLVINLKNGKVGGLKHLCNEFRVNDGMLIIEEYDTLIQFKLKDIFEELDRLN